MSNAAPSIDALEQRMVQFKHDPLGFVYYAFNWGQGALLNRSPHDWQIELLKYLGDQLVLGQLNAYEAIQIARRSGHGIGKSALVAWLILWALSTLTDTRGVVTANTDNQLKGKTWPELAKWHRMCITAEWFKFTATALFAADPKHEKTWRIDCVPWSENNTEAFAGLHNAGKRILLIFDEASAIPKTIYEVAEGALTDENTEIIWVQFGNPTRNQGRFHDSFNKLKHRWNVGSIDSRTVPGTNKVQIAKWIADYGEDSDFIRIRVRGLAPKASYNQYISADLVQKARNRPMEYTTPRVACVGVDVARFGDDESVIRTRIGRDARSIPTQHFRELSTTQLAGKVAEHVNYLKGQLSLRVVLFIDGGAMGGGVVDILLNLGYEVIEVLFGSGADNPKMYFNKRAEMYGRMRAWMKVGYLSEDDEQLETEATAVLYTMPKDVIQLEKKEQLKAREGFSPDDSDALACTFAYPVPDQKPTEVPLPFHNVSNARRTYDPYTPRD